MTEQTPAAPTLGPWKAGLFERADNGVPIYTVSTGSKVAVAKYLGGTAVAHQNAHLIAAAPETARERDRLVAENERLQSVNERDRSQVADVFNAIMEAIRRREWLRLGRGSYEYDDDRWRGEFSEAIDEVIEATKPLQRIAADRSDCPTDSKKIAAARAVLSEARQFEGAA